MILYEDAALVVLDKPAGLSSEEGVPAALRKHWGRPDAYVGVIHRLDTGVSGLMVYAKPPMRRTHRPSGRSTAPSSRAGRTKRSPPEASCATTYSRTAGRAGSSRSAAPARA